MRRVYPLPFGGMSKGRDYASGSAGGGQATVIGGVSVLYPIARRILRMLDEIDYA